MNKKADANMWWIIIGAIIALVVLVILMLIFTGSTNKLNLGLMDCESKGGTCSMNAEGCKNAEGTVSHAFDCPKEKEQSSGIIDKLFSSSGNNAPVCCFLKNTKDDTKSN
jgi:hypothetical protein